LEGSSPGETHNEGTHNGGIDVVGRTGRVWGQWELTISKLRKYDTFR